MTFAGPCNNQYSTPCKEAVSESAVPDRYFEKVERRTSDTCEEHNSSTKMNPLQRVETLLGPWFTWPNYIVRYSCCVSPNPTSCKISYSFFMVMKIIVSFI